jgi:flavin reductase (DIM6/NTAB) family NADH-FMN oxidoreductase RutF
MKKEYSSHPQSMAKFNMEMYGFSWQEFVAAIPSPLLVATSYKSNGKPNACLQSWVCFNSNHAILSSVNMAGHLYQTVKETGVCVLNFPSAEIYDRCCATIENNDFDTDEITASGLTVERAALVNAPRIAECFLALECRLLWDKRIAEGDNHVLMCFEIVNVAIDSAHLDEKSLGRYGETGLLYNIHHPINPEDFSGTAHDYLGVLTKFRDMGEY